MKITIICLIVLISLIQSRIIIPSSPIQPNNHFQIVYRDLVGKNNREKILKLNSQSSKFKLAENKFIQFSQEQFQSLYLTTKIPNITSTIIVESTPIIQFGFPSPTTNTFGSQNTYSYGSFGGSTFTNEDINIDWKRDGKVTSVKDQGKCGSCWAFTAISDLQSSLIIKGHPITIDLSEQQLIDCSSVYGNSGCAGGWTVNAFNYMTNVPITTQSNYPYSGSTKNCQIKVGSFSIRNIKQYKNNNNCQALVDILKTRPLTVGVAADPLFWAFYQQGVLDRCPGQINHAVVLTGVKSDPLDNYWTIKNSWGQYWGQRGYMRIDRSQNGGNTCRICQYPAFSDAL